MKRLESVLFDLDGTLLDSKLGVIDSLRHAVFAAGIAPPDRDAMRWCVGPRLRSVLESLLNTQEPELIERAHAVYVEHYAREGMQKARAFAGVPQMLERLHQSEVRLYLVSAKLTPIAQRMLRFCELDSFFDSVMGAHPDARFEEKAQPPWSCGERISLPGRPRWSAIASLTSPGRG